VLYRIIKYIDKI